MSGYRVWPAGLMTAAALAAACVVVGEHVVQTEDGCLGSETFVATPAAWPADAIAAGLDGKLVPVKADIGRLASDDRISESSDAPPSADLRITGCLDVAQIEIPAPTPDTDGRA